MGEQMNTVQSERDWKFFIVPYMGKKHEILIDNVAVF